MTPSAKYREPTSERQATENKRSASQPLTSTSMSYVVGEHLSGFEIKKRRCSLKSLIHEHFEVNVGDEHFVTREELLQTLGLDSSKRLTQVSTDFPDVKTSRHVFSGKVREIVYSNIKNDGLSLVILSLNSGKLWNGRRIHSASHYVVLVGQKISNDFTMLFTILCILYGAGSLFIGMLNIGLTVSWKKVMQVLDDRMEKMKDHIKQPTPTDIAIILLMQR